MRQPMLAALLAAGIAAAMPGTPAPAQDRDSAIRISDAWARPTIPARPGAGYMVLVNTAEEADILREARAEGAETVQVHMVNEQLGVAEMLEVESLEVEPGEELLFAPGRLHLMFSGLADPLAVGDRFPATLVFENAGEVEVEFEVREEPPAGFGEENAGAGSD